LNHVEKLAREHIAEAQRLLDRVREKLEEREIDWMLLIELLGKIGLALGKAAHAQLEDEDGRESDPGGSPGGRFDGH
jgi:hypothetical protein